MAGNVWFHYNTRFSCILFLQAWTSRCQPKHTWTPSKNPDFYDTCDAGVLIGKLPCTSTLAQSVANIPSHRKGRPRVMYHMNCLHVSCGSKQRGSNISQHPVYTSLSGVALATKPGTNPVFPTRYNLPPPPSPGGKQHCLTSAIREPTEQYWRPEAAAATAYTELGGNLLKLTVYCSLCVSFSPGLTPERVRGNQPEDLHKFPKL